MTEHIYDPLTEYTQVFRDRFKEVCDKTFAELAQEAQVNQEANQETCRQLYDTQQAVQSVNNRIGWWKTGCWAIALIVTACICIYFIQKDLLQQIQISILIATVIASILVLLSVLLPHLTKLKQKRDQLSDLAKDYQDEAWQQMAPLNRLYDWDILTRMMSQTVPRLAFDPYFTTQRLADLKQTYHWNDAFNAERSVIYSHSGLINGNPFIICRTRKMQMGSKTYEGTKTIYWTTRERGSDGKYHSVSHSQTLHAYVTADYPEYKEKSRLIYGNTAAPNLVFHRKQNGMAGQEGSWSYKWKRRSLRKKARDLSHSDYAMMTNEDFEVAFDTHDRNHNQQFALLFTPLAQESMLKLLKDRSVGFGDDFDFDKEEMINIITPQHLQDLDLDLNPEQYRHFDYRQAQQDFYTLNARYFKAIYFSLAPLLCVPMYQQIRPQHDIYGHDMQRQSSFWEHEALANFWGDQHFMDPRCVTPCILKTEPVSSHESQTTLTVHAHGYRVEQRVSYISKWGNDGRFHNVPVYWDEYLPVTGTGQLQLKEDNELQEKPITHHQRLNHISEVLRQHQFDIYRRHIASKVTR